MSQAAPGVRRRAFFGGTSSNWPRSADTSSTRQPPTRATFATRSATLAGDSRVLASTVNETASNFGLRLGGVEGVPTRERVAARRTVFRLAVAFRFAIRNAPYRIPRLKGGYVEYYS